MKKVKTIGLVLPGPIKYSETFFKSKIEGLQEAGYKVVIFCPKGNKDNNYKYKFQWRLSSSPSIRPLLVILGIIYLFSIAPRRSFRYLKLNSNIGRSLFSTIRALYINIPILSYPKLDALHFGFASMGVDREVLGQVLKIRLSTSFRGYDLSSFVLNNHPDIYKHLWPRLFNVHSISNHLLDTAYQLGLPREKPTHLIPPCIDAERFNNPNPVIFFAKTSINIITVGRLHWMKAYEYALRAMKILADKGIAFNYTIVGDGEDLEKLYYTRFQLGLEDKVHFTGKVQAEMLPPILWENDIYLQPSINEGFCNASLEAQAAGLLCIASDIGGLPENIVDQQTGWLVPARSPEAIADKIISLSKMPQEQLQQVSQKAVDRVHTHFNLNEYTKAFIQFYEA